MKPGAIGKKIGMSQIIEENGKVIPVTYVQLLEGVVTHIKKEEKDGYNALVVGFMPLNKTTKNKKYKILKEFKIDEAALNEVKTGDKLTVDQFEEVNQIRVTSVSKGKGFQGVMKKYNFRGGNKTHGSTFHRAPGSIGACAKPGRVHKGKKLPGRMGGEKMTIKRNVVGFEKEFSTIAISGPVPGANKSILTINIIS